MLKLLLILMAFYVVLVTVAYVYPISRTMEIEGPGEEPEDAPQDADGAVPQAVTESEDVREAFDEADRFDGPEGPASTARERSRTAS